MSLTTMCLFAYDFSKQYSSFFTFYVISLDVHGIKQAAPLASYGWFDTISLSYKRILLQCVKDKFHNTALVNFPKETTKGFQLNKEKIQLLDATITEDS